MCIYVHRGSYIRVSKQFLHFLAFVAVIVFLMVAYRDRVYNPDYENKINRILNYLSGEYDIILGAYM